MQTLSFGFEIVISTFGYEDFVLQGSSVLADLGTEQVELIALSQRTGNPKYMEKVS